MADEVDRAGDQYEVLVEHLIKNASSCSLQYPVTGMCLNCEEPVPEGARWCDFDCQSDFLRRQ